MMTTTTERPAVIPREKKTLAVRIKAHAAKLRRQATRVVCGAVLTAELLSACAPKNSHPTPDVLTPTQPIATETFPPTPTLTVTPTPTETPTPTPTEIPMSKIYYEFTGAEKGEWKLDLSAIPEIPYEDITSGRLAQTERKLLEQGKISPFGENVVPFRVGDIVNNDDSGYPQESFSEIFVEGGVVLERFWEKHEPVPMRLVSLSFTEVEGVKLLVVGEMRLNADRTVSFVHYAFQNYENPFVAKMIEKYVAGKYYSFIITRARLDIKVYPRWYDVGKNEPFMLELYNDPKEAEKRKSLASEYVSTGIVPEEMERMLWIGILDAINPYTDR
jgi:hypothetical protein